MSLIGTCLRAATVLFALAFVHASAADARPSADPSQPVTIARIGGSPADARFREENQRALDTHRQAVRECKRRPGAERKSCTASANAEFRAAQTQARATLGKAKPAVSMTK